MNRTVPLARPLDVRPPALAAPAVRAPEATSGVFASRLPPGDPRKATDPRAGNLLPPESGPVSRRAPSPWLLVCVFVAVAATGGAVAAWLLR